MKAKLVNWWHLLRSSLWFVPGIITLVAVALAIGLERVDLALALHPVGLLGLIYAGGPTGARILLSTIAGSTITVAGVTFSITIAVLTMTSSQFGPRLLKNFVEDAHYQVVLGMFVATFVYCLLVLQAIRSGHVVFVPRLAVTVGIALSLLSVAALILFIHRVSTSIQADNVIADVYREFETTMNRLYPTRYDEDPGDLTTRPQGINLPNDAEAEEVLSLNGGYVHIIDESGLMTLAKDKDVVLSLVRKPGDFVVEGALLARAWPGSAVNDELTEAINRCFLLGVQRVSIQDVQYRINQLVEIAVRALSPGINDPFTAVICVERLGAALATFAQRRMPLRYSCDDNGELRIVHVQVEFSDLVDTAFTQIRQFGYTSFTVVMALLEAIGVVCAQVHREPDRKVLCRQADLIRRAGLAGIIEDCDKQRVDERFHFVIGAMERHEDPRPARNTSAMAPSENRHDTKQPCAAAQKEP